MDWVRMLKNVGITILAWVSGFVATIAVAVLLNLFKYPMPFFSTPNLVYLLYGVPIVVCQVVVYTYFLKGIEDQTWMAAKTTLAIMMVLLTFFTRLAFVLSVNVGFGVLGWIVARRAFKGEDIYEHYHYWRVFHLIDSLIASFHRLFIRFSASVVSLSSDWRTRPPFDVILLLLCLCRSIYTDHGTLRDKHYAQPDYRNLHCLYTLNPRIIRDCPNLHLFQEELLPNVDRHLRRRHCLCGGWSRSNSVHGQDTNATLYCGKCCRII